MRAMANHTRKSIANDRWSALLTAGVLLAALAGIAFLSAAPGDAVQRIVAVSVALLVSGLAIRARAQARIAAQRTAELSALYELSQALEAEVDLANILPIIAQTTARILAVPGCQILLVDADGALVRRAATGVTAVGVPTEDAVLGTETHALGVLRVARRAPGRPFTNAEHELLCTIAVQAALVIERVRLAEVAGHARALAESDKLKSTLLSLVSHDLRTPLAVIKGLATSLQDESIDWPPQVRAEMLTTIEEETDRLNRIVGELLEMSRIEAGAISQMRGWHDLDELIVATVEALRPRIASHPFVLDVPSDLPWVRISYPQIEQVLRNLLENATHYTPPAAPIEVWARVSEQQIRVEVRDRGAGVPQALHEHIFEKFVRVTAAERHAEGAGLGLAICKGLIEAHGGRIWVEDRVGGGAVFVVVLPVEAHPAPSVVAA